MNERIVVGESANHKSLPFFYYLIALRPKYLPQGPILDHTQPMFLRQCERPIFTPTQNNRQNYSSVYFSSSYFGDLAKRQTVLH